MLEAYERVLRGRAERAASRGDGARRPPRGLEGLHRPRLPPRPRHRPLDRHDDDRVSEDRRGRRDRARRRTWSSRCTRTRSRTNGARLPLHAGHVARRAGRRDPALGSSVADLRACPSVWTSLHTRGEPGAYSEQGAIALFPEAGIGAQPSIRHGVRGGRGRSRGRWGSCRWTTRRRGASTRPTTSSCGTASTSSAETIVRVDHSLLALPGSTIDELGEVVSHPAGDRPVRGVPQRPRRDRAGRVQHRRCGKADRREPARADGGDRIAARGGAVRARKSSRIGSRRTRTTTRASARSRVTRFSARRAGQVVARLRSRSRRRLALPLPRLARRAAPEPDEARVTTTGRAPRGSTSSRRRPGARPTCRRWSTRSRS